MEVVYAGNNVPHLLPGKTVSRALQSHQLLDLVFNAVLFEDLLPKLDVDFCVFNDWRKQWQVRH